MGFTFCTRSLFSYLVLHPATEIMLPQNVRSLEKAKKNHPAPPAKRQTIEIFMLFIFHREFFYSSVLFFRIQLQCKHWKKAKLKTFHTRESSKRNKRNPSLKIGRSRSAKFQFQPNLFQTACGVLPNFFFVEIALEIDLLERYLKFPPQWFSHRQPHALGDINKTFNCFLHFIPPLTELYAIILSRSLITISAVATIGWAYGKIIGEKNAR